MARKAIIFDVDGTLVDSNDQHAASWVDTFRQFGFDIPFRDVRAHIGKGGDNLVPSLLPPGAAEAGEEPMSDVRALIFKRDYRDQVTPFPAVCDLFRRAREDGWVVALASSGTADEINYYQDLIGCRDLVSVVTTTDDAERSKPDPDIFAAALKKAGVSAAHAVVVGDSPFDMEAAGKLGIRTIALRCGGFADDDLQQAGALALFQDPADLLQRYDASALAGRDQ